MRKYYFIWSFILFIYHFHALASSRRDSVTTISGTVFLLNDGDSVRLHIHRFGSDIWVNGWDENLFCVIKNHSFQFVLKGLSEIKYIDIVWMRPIPGVDRQLIGYPVSYGQKIIVDIKRDSTFISGPGSAEFLAVYKMNQVVAKALAANRSSDNVFDDVISWFRLSDSVEAIQEKILKSDGLKLPEEAMRRTMGMILTRREISKWEQFALFYRNEGFQHRLKEVYGTRLENRPCDYFLPFFKKVDSSVACRSPLFPSLVALEIQIDSSIFVGKSLDLVGTYWLIERNYSGTLRDNILGKVLFNNRRPVQYPVDQDGFNFMASKALEEVKDTAIVQLIGLVTKGSKSGEPAYRFQLKDSSNHTWSLLDFKGKPILVHYWFTGCGNCIRVIPYLKEIEQQYSALGVEFISICIDYDRTKWIRSLRSRKYITGSSIDLLSEMHDGKDLMASFYSVSGCPFFLLIDSNLHVVGSMLDPRYDNGREMRKQLDKVLGILPDKRISEL